MATRKKTTRKKTRKKSTSRVGGAATKKQRGRPRGSRGLRTASVEELQAELQRRESELGNLYRIREDLIAQLQRIDQDILERGGNPEEASTPTPRRGRPPKSGRGPGRPRGSGRGPGRPRGSGRGPGRPRGSGSGRRPKNTTNLVDALQKVLSNKVMSVQEAVEEVQKAGYKTSSKSFRTIVNQALLNNPDRFEKVDRGKYTAKS